MLWALVANAQNLDERTGRPGNAPRINPARYQQPPTRPPIKLDRPETNRGTDDDNSRRKGSSQIGTTIAALAFVVLLIVAGAKLLKKHSPMLSGNLPDEALDVLGRKYIDQRNSILLLRCGSRLFLVGVSPEGMNTLGEIDDPAEVDLLAGISRSAESDRSFQQLFMRQRSRQLAETQRAQQPQSQPQQQATPTSTAQRLDANAQIGQAARNPGHVT